MTSRIELEFRQKCTRNSSYELLLAQWEYEKRLARRALATVSRTFPHYSLHDSSHSETILLRIGAIVGNRIELLSATDLWLILHGAYLHDLGMVTLHAQRDADLRSSEFGEFIKRTTHGSADLGLRADRLLAARSAPTSFAALNELAEDLTVLHAEFVRPDHARRSSKAVLEPRETLGTEPPRTLIPNRFWGLIATIVAAHGKRFSAIFDELPQVESGVAEDLCHPRFVACMLRLGDLLDLDSGRFCPTQWRSIGRPPEVSEAHKRKHDGVSRLLVTERRIEVGGLYSDTDAYVEAEHWFTWLREELGNQQARWADVSPDGFGALPSCGLVQARIVDQVVLDEGQRPRFEIDRKRVLTLVRGANLYNGPADAVREIVQNAVDATLLRYALELGGTGPAPDPTTLRTFLARWPIEVSLAQHGQRAGDSVMYRLRVTDQGIGMSKADLSHLLRVGGSIGNEPRERLRASLPLWMQPSGTFGLGFHSLFEHTDSVTMWTRHVDEASGYKISFIKDSADEIRITILEWNGSRARGTTVECTVQLGAYPLSWNSDIARETPALSKFDFVAHDHAPYEPARMALTVSEMAEASIATIVLSGPIQPRQLDTQTSSGWYFHAESGARVRLHRGRNGRSSLLARFKGAPVETSSRLLVIDVETDLWIGDARKLLQVSRNKWTAQGQRVFDDARYTASKAALPSWIEQLAAKLSTLKGDENGAERKEIADELCRLSLWAKIAKATVENVNAEFPSLWRGYPVQSEERRHLCTLAQLVDVNSVQIETIVEKKTPDAFERRYGRLTTDQGVFDLEHVPEIVLIVLEQEFGPPSLIGLGEKDFPIYLHSKQPQAAVSASTFAEIYWPSEHSLSELGVREVAPCPSERDFAILEIPEEASVFHGGRIQRYRQQRVMANPFVRIDGSVMVLHPQQYIHWLVATRQRYGLATAPAGVAKSLRIFIEMMVTAWKDNPAKVNQLRVDMSLLNHELEQASSSDSR